MRDMKKLVIVASILLATVALAQEAPAESPPEPPPPQSFCGFTFGEVYTNAAHVALTKPFRYCTQASIRRTLNEQRIFEVTIHGTTSESMSDEDAQTEFQRMCEVIGAKLGVKLERHGKGLAEGHGYTCKTFRIDAKYERARKGGVFFRVMVVRKDILEADKNAAKKGAPPLPPGDGIDNL